MNRYEASIPRVAFAIAAVAMTAITIGVSVVMPAKMDSNRGEVRMLAASKVTTPAFPRVVTGSASIGVVAAGEPGLSTVRCTSSKANRKPEG